jgi:hypothetical protein
MRTITNEEGGEYEIDDNNNLVTPLRISMGVDGVFTYLEDEGRDSLYRFLADRGGFKKMTVGVVIVEKAEKDDITFLIYGNASAYLPAPSIEFELVVPYDWDDDVAQYVKDDWDARLKGESLIEHYWKWIGNGDFDTYPPFAPAESWELAGVDASYSDKNKHGLLGLKWKSPAHMLRAWAAVGAPVIPPKF